MGFTKWLKDNKTEFQVIVAALLIFFGCLLIGAGFITATPIGAIHNSLLWIFGQILVFAGAIFGIDYHYKIKDK